MLNYEVNNITNLKHCCTNFLKCCQNNFEAKISRFWLSLKIYSAIIFVLVSIKTSTVLIFKKRGIQYMCIKWTISSALEKLNIVLV